MSKTVERRHLGIMSDIKCQVCGETAQEELRFAAGGNNKTVNMAFCHIHRYKMMNQLNTLYSPPINGLLRSDKVELIYRESDSVVYSVEAFPEVAGYNLFFHDENEMLHTPIAIVETLEEALTIIKVHSKSYLNAEARS